jgi:hypothetical protein
MMTAETGEPERAQWITNLDAVAALEPALVVAGHKKAGNDDDPKIISAHSGTPREQPSRGRTANSVGRVDDERIPVNGVNILCRSARRRFRGDLAGPEPAVKQYGGAQLRLGEHQRVRQLRNSILRRINQLRQRLASCLGVAFDQLAAVLEIVRIHYLRPDRGPHLRIAAQKCCQGVPQPKEDRYGAGDLPGRQRAQEAQDAGWQRN